MPMGSIVGLVPVFGDYSFEAQALEGAEAPPGEDYRSPLSLQYY